MAFVLVLMPPLKLQGLVFYNHVASAINKNCLFDNLVGSAITSGPTQKLYGLRYSLWLSLKTQGLFYINMTSIKPQPLLLS
jgi:hypothetical protein